MAVVEAGLREGGESNEVKKRGRGLEEGLLREKHSNQRAVGRLSIISPFEPHASIKAANPRSHPQ
jgi:hypothetical protein